MAAYRKISVTFWSDSFVQSLTPEGKYFYLYLMTNTRTTQCGIYEITISQMCFETGYNHETINKLLKQLESLGKIKYSFETNEIGIINWPKHNDSTSPKVMACVNKELHNIKATSLIYALGYDMPKGIKFNPNYRVSDSLRDEIISISNNKCTKCGASQSLQIDHIIPRSLGGKSIKENLRCLCNSCNSSRPLFGEELIIEVQESGYSFIELCKLQGIDYKYSMRRQSQETKEETKEETKIIVDDVLPFESDNFRTAWNEWCEYRKQIKKKLTQKTKQMQLRTLGAKPEREAIDMINQSIGNGWTGLFEFKTYKNGTNKGLDPDAALRAIYSDDK